MTPINTANVQTAWILIMTIWGVITLIGLWVLYAIIKAAVREGIKESGLLDALRYRQQPVRPVTDLPEMRAD